MNPLNQEKLVIIRYELSGIPNTLKFNCKSNWKRKKQSHQAQDKKKKKESNVPLMWTLKEIQIPKSIKL